MTLIEQVEAINQSLTEIARVLAKPFEPFMQCSDKTVPLAVKDLPLSHIITSNKTVPFQYDMEWHRKTAETILKKYSTEVDNDQVV